MHLVNFKGAKDLTLTFNRGVTRILGRNGSGKTTVFDAFTWLLFGKDSNDKKTFSIKTLDENGEPIMHLPHEVSAVLSVNGEPLTLRRAFTEKWTKRRGSAEAEFTGHEEERFWNDVPCSQREYNEKISDLCNEQVFKLITNPTYFEKQDVATKRALLIRMAGGIKDEEIAAGHNDFVELLAMLTGKRLEEFKREISAKKSRVKSEIEALPERIDERKRDIPGVEDWASIEKEIEGLQAQQKELDDAVADQAEAQRQSSGEKQKLVEQLYQLRGKKTALEFQLKEQVVGKSREKKIQQNKLRNEVTDIVTEVERYNAQIQKLDNKLGELSEQRTQLIDEFRKIKAERLEFSESDFICPTCHRHFEIDEIADKQEEMTARFNERRAAKLEDNKHRGLAVRANIDKLNEEKEAIRAAIEKANAKIEAAKNEPLYSEDLGDEPQVDISSNEDYKALCQEEDALRSQVENFVERFDSTKELQEQSKAISGKITDLKVRLSKRGAIEQNEQRVAELEEQLRSQNMELARLEKLEMTIHEFSKARISYIEDKINAMFRVVKFKMFSKQINGGEVETCETTVNGVPYNGGLNNAMRIIAGLDIINTICKHEGISAPIFVDNAESINELPSMESQLISLVVTEDQTLKIVSENNTIRTSEQLMLF